LYGIEWLIDQVNFLRGKTVDVDLSQSYVNTHSKEIMKAFSTISEDSGLNIKLESENYIDLPLNEELNR
jgi:hypothetical protein